MGSMGSMGPTNSHGYTGCGEAARLGEAGSVLQRGGVEGGHRCGGSAGGPPKSTHHYCFNGASRVKLTYTEHTHTHTR